jgi:hypothetical protein
MRVIVTSLLCALALPLAAQELEQLLLPVEPSVMFCSHNAEYDTRLIAYNMNEHPVRLVCAEDNCGAVGRLAGSEITGASTAPAYPTFLYLPKSDVDGVRMSLVVESSVRDHPEDHSFAELPIAHASDFRDSKITLVGVRMDAGFRQALRIFGLDGTLGQVMVRAYNLKTDELLYEEAHWLWPQSDERTANGMPLRPSLSIECDLSAELPDLHDGQYVRIELEPLTPGYKFWSFVSLTNNKTQHFYTVTPH